MSNDYCILEGPFCKNIKRKTEEKKSHIHYCSNENHYMILQEFHYSFKDFSKIK